MVFHIQILVNFTIFKLLLNLSLAHLKVQIACYELKGDLSPVMLKGIFLDCFENFEIYEDLYGKPYKHDRVTTAVFCIQMFSHVAVSTFEIYG